MRASLLVIGVLFCAPLLWALVVLAVAVRAYFAMFRPRFDSPERNLAYCLEQGDFDETFLSLPWEAVAVASPRGYALATFALPAAAPSRENENAGAGTVVFVHGFTSTRYNMMKYMGPFRERGWNVVAFDLAGHGDSPAPRSLSRAPSFGFYEKDDLGAVLAWASRRFSASGPFVLVGESMGAATVLQYAPVGVDGEARGVDAIIADCSFSSAFEELSARLRAEGIPRFVAGGAAASVAVALKVFRGFRLEEASPMAAIMRSATPILLIHGGDDRYVPTEMSTRMAEERRRRGVGPTELLVVSEARHAKSVVVDRSAWFSTVFAFIDKYASDRTKS